jgi:alanine-glyoxylate transaminase/serine-glyoxylate transaminase/serine-pyruvate transaminase
MAKRQGPQVILIEQEWGKAVDPESVEQTIQEHSDASGLAFVHAETSTGVLSDCKAICALAESAGMLSIVDTVTSLAGSPLEVDKWHVDVSYSGTQKCLSAPPGISPITFSKKAMDKISRRKTPCLSWFLDVSLLSGYWQEGGKRSYHHTAPVNSMFAVLEALRLVLEEGVEQRWHRHSQMHEKLKMNLESLGLRFFVDKGIRTPQLNSIEIPSHVDDSKVRKALLNDFAIEIGGGLGPLAGKVWRIGLMGDSANEGNIEKLTSALKKLL